MAQIAGYGVRVNDEMKRRIRRMYRSPYGERMRFAEAYSILCDNTGLEPMVSNAESGKEYFYLAVPVDYRHDEVRSIEYLSPVDEDAVDVLDDVKHQLGVDLPNQYFLAYAYEEEELAFDEDDEDEYDNGENHSFFDDRDWSLPWFLSGGTKDDTETERTEEEEADPQDESSERSRDNDPFLLLIDLRDKVLRDVDDIVRDAPPAVRDFLRQFTDTQETEEPRDFHHRRR